jgi:hypothetical protein
LTKERNGSIIELGTLGESVKNDKEDMSKLRAVLQYGSLFYRNVKHAHERILP